MKSPWTGFFFVETQYSLCPKLIKFTFIFSETVAATKQKIQNYQNYEYPYHYRHQSYQSRSFQTGKSYTSPQFRWSDYKPVLTLENKPNLNGPEILKDIIGVYLSMGLITGLSSLICGLWNLNLANSDQLGEIKLKRTIVFNFLSIAILISGTYLSIFYGFQYSRCVIRQIAFLTQLSINSLIVFFQLAYLYTLPWFPSGSEVTLT